MSLSAFQFWSLMISRKCLAKVCLFVAATIFWKIANFHSRTTTSSKLAEIYWRPHGPPFVQAPPFIGLQWILAAQWLMSWTHGTSFSPNRFNILGFIALYLFPQKNLDNNIFLFSRARSPTVVTQIQSLDSIDLNNSHFMNFALLLFLAFISGSVPWHNEATIHLWPLLPKISRLIIRSIFSW